MAVSAWLAQRNEKARARLMRNLPEIFPGAVLLHALSRHFSRRRRDAQSTRIGHHPVRADILARALAAFGGAPEGWVWRVGIQKSSGPPVTFRVPPTPFREPAFAKGAGHCCVCGQPIFRFGWHLDLWDDGCPNRNATWHSCCVAAWNLWIAPSDHVRPLKAMQKRRCPLTGKRLLKNAEVDHQPIAHCLADGHRLLHLHLDGLAQPASRRGTVILRGVVGSVLASLRSLNHR